MIRTLAAAALLFGLVQEKPAQEPDGAREARALFEKVEARVKAAKTVRIAFKASISMAMGMGDDDEGRQAFSGEALLRNPAEARLKMTGKEGEAVWRSDGKRVVVEGHMGPNQPVLSPGEPKEFAEQIQKLVTHGIMSMKTGETDELGLKEPTSFFLGGREKVGDVDARMIQYDHPTAIPPIDRITVRAWIDTAKLVVIKREYEFRSFARMTETVTSIAFDEALPADEFAFQSARALAVAIEGQIARSVELFAHYTGRLPEKLEELDAARNKDDFWPEGGFWPGGKRPAVAYSVKEGVAKVGERTVAAPLGGRVRPSSDRLKQHYTARIRLQLLQAAVEAWHQAYVSLPENLAQLTARPKDIDFWPEGGFVGATFLKDPWGAEWKFVSRPGGAVIAISNPKERVLREKQLLAEELKALREGAFPEGTPESRKTLETLLERFIGGDLEDREAATVDLLKFGPAALAKIEERIDAAGKGETSVRLKRVRDKLQASGVSWRKELASLSVECSSGPGKKAGTLDDNERSASTCLKVITTAEADFRSNDRDGNREMDFWVRDVAGLYGIVGATGEGREPHAGKEGEANIIKLIEPSLAAADATEGKWEYGTLGVSEPEPHRGYLFAALKKGVLGGAPVVYMDPGSRADMFGFIAYPADYGVTGRFSFIVNEDNTVWKKDLGGETVDTFPGAPAAEGWTQVD